MRKPSFRLLALARREARLAWLRQVSARLVTTEATVKSAAAVWPARQLTARG